MNLFSKDNKPIQERSFFICIDKPRNMISHEVSSYVKKILGAYKTGHAGTLDPNVSGVLIIGVNKARKLLRFLSKQDKEYISSIKFKKEKSSDELERIFKKFRGKISQIPPKMSAVAKKKRTRTIYKLELLDIKGKEALFKAEVEAGTYIRTLCKDMGGKMTELRRIRSGPITERECYTMQDLQYAKYLYDKGFEFVLESMLTSVEEMFFRLSFPKVGISKHTAKNVVRGAPIYGTGIIENEPFRKGDLLSVFCKEKFVGIGKAHFDSFSFKTKDKVITMERVHLDSI